MLVITAVAAERDAVVRSLDTEPEGCGPYDGLYASSSQGELTVIAGGVGMAAAAAATATALADGSFDVVFCMGIGGGFDGMAKAGELVMASAVIAPGLGADSPDGFLTIDELGFGTNQLSPGRPWQTIAAAVGARTGPILSVNTVTGTDERALELARVWQPAAEGMEGWGVFSAAKAHGVTAYEIRAISNRVGRRDRSSWDIAGALDALGRAGDILFEELQP